MAKKKVEAKKVSKASKKSPKKVVKKSDKAANSTKDRSFVAKAPIRRLMRQEGANLVSDEALGLLIEKVEEIAMKTTKTALSLVKDEKRKRLTAEDIQWASNQRV